MSTSTTKTRAGSPKLDDKLATKRNRAGRRKYAFNLSKHASLPELNELSTANNIHSSYPHTHLHVGPSPDPHIWTPSPLKGARISHDAAITRARRSSAPDSAKSKSKPVWLSFRVELEKRKHTKPHDARSSVFRRSNSASTRRPPTPSLTSSHASESTLSASSGPISQISQGNVSSQRLGRGRLPFLKKPKSLDLLHLSSSGSTYSGGFNRGMQSHGDRSSVLLHSSTCTHLQRAYRDGDEKNGDGDRKLGGDIVVRATAATKASLFSLPSEVPSVATTRSVDRSSTAMASTSSTTTLLPRESTSTITPRTSASKLKLKLKASTSASTLRLKASTSTASLKLLPRAKNLRTLRPVAQKATLTAEELQDATVNSSALATGPSDEDDQHDEKEKGKEKESGTGTFDENDKIDSTNVEDDVTTLLNDDTGTGSSRLRTLRRRKHLNVNILQIAPIGGTKLEPISISLDDAKVSPDQESSPLLGNGDVEEKEGKRNSYIPKTQVLGQQSKPHQYPVFVPHTYSYPGRPQQAQSQTPTTPTTPTRTSHGYGHGHGYAPVVPPSTAPSGLLSTSHEATSNPIPIPIEPQPKAQAQAQASPVRLGHPSRPYYTAIRRNFGAGVSGVTTAFNSSSLSAATGRGVSRHQYSSSLSSIGSVQTQVRPHSYQPPGTPTQLEYSNIDAQGPEGASTTTTSNSIAAKHLSMPAVIDFPLRLSAMSIPLIDSLDDEDDGFSNGGSLLGPAPPTPAPGRISFSLFNSHPSTTTNSSTSAAVFSSSTGAASVNANATDTVRRMSRNGGGILLPSSPPAPLLLGSNSASSSPSSSDHDDHRNHHHYHGHSHSMSKSLSRMSGKGDSRNMSNTNSIGRGFSMSGQTELRMVLAARDAAASSASAVENGQAGELSHSGHADSSTFGFAHGLELGNGTSSAGVSSGFRFRETQPQVEQLEPPWTAVPDLRLSDVRERGERKDSFMGRVRKLRKGLRDMIGMDSH